MSAVVSCSLWCIFLVITLFVYVLAKVLLPRQWVCCASSVLMFSLLGVNIWDLVLICSYTFVFGLGFIRNKHCPTSLARPCLVTTYASMLLSLSGGPVAAPNVLLLTLSSKLIFISSSMSKSGLSGFFKDLPLAAGLGWCPSLLPTPCFYTLNLYFSTLTLNTDQKMLNELQSFDPFASARG